MSEKDTKKCISDKISHTNSVTESSNSKRRKFYFLIFVIGNVVEKESKGCKKIQRYSQVLIEKLHFCVITVQRSKNLTKRY